MGLSAKSRLVERDIFGVLLGTLAGAMVVRLLLLAFDLGPFALLTIMGIGAWSGGFVMHVFAQGSEQAVQSLSGFVARMQKPFLTSMLWLLGASAVIGVVTVLMTNDELLVRLLGTTFATAIAASLLWRASCVVDRETHQLAALFGMGVVFLVYLLVMPLIWDFGDEEARMLMTAVMLAFTAPAAMLFLRSIYNNSTRVAGVAGIVVYVIVVALFLVAIWHQEGRRWGRDNWWLQAAWSLTWLGPLGVASLAGVTWAPRAAWRWLGVVASIIAWLLVANSAWDHGMEVLTACIISVAITVAHASVVTLIHLTTRQQWVRLGTIAAAILTALLLDMHFIAQGGVEAEDSIVLRFAGAAAIVGSSGTLALAILAVLNRGVAVPSRDGSCTTITVFCPRCRKKQTISTGGAKCSACELRIHVRIGEADSGANMAKTDSIVAAITSPAPNIPDAPRRTFQFGLRSILLVMAIVAVLAAVIGVPWARRRHELALQQDLRAIALAMHNYHDVYKCFPPPYFADSNGTPMHSWRVILLPMFGDPEADRTYAAYDFSQPWDSPSNAAVTKTMPKVYRHALRRDQQPFTDYMAIVGKGTLFDPSESIKFSKVLDGTSNTLMVVEVAGSRTRWSEPSDLNLKGLPLKINASRNGDAISGRTPEGTLVAFTDGRTEWLPDDLDPEDLRRMILRNDGEPFEKWAPSF